MNAPFYYLPYSDPSSPVGLELGSPKPRPNFDFHFEKHAFSEHGKNIQPYQIRGEGHRRRVIMHAILPKLKQ